MSRRADSEWNGKWSKIWILNDEREYDGNVDGEFAGLLEEGRLVQERRYTNPLSLNKTA